MAGFEHRSSHQGLALRTKVGIGDGRAASAPPGALTQATAIWDTGATHSLISSRMVARLELLPIGFSPLRSIRDERDAAVYWVWLRIPNGARGAAMWRIPVLEEELGPDVDFLIGMDIITKGDLHVTRGSTGAGPTSSLVFRVAE